MGNLELQKKKDVSLFRKIAIGTWKTSYDSQVYGTMQIRMDNAAKYIEDYRAATGKRLTVTHLMARAVGQVLKENPDVNAIMRFNRVYLRKRIGVFMQVVMTDEGTDKIDLSGVTIYDVPDKTMDEIIDEVEDKVRVVRKREDPALEKTRGLFRYIPYMFLNLFLKTIAFLSYTLNLNLKWAGIPEDPFGSVMITNVGSLGLDVAYVPVVPYSRVPILLAVGEIKDEPVVDDGKLVVGKTMAVSATFDHRFIDGFHAAAMSRTLRTWMERPEEFFGPIPEKTAPKQLETEAE